MLNIERSRGLIFLSIRRMHKMILKLLFDVECHDLLLRSFLHRFDSSLSFDSFNGFNRFDGLSCFNGFGHDRLLGNVLYAREAED